MGNNEASNKTKTGYCIVIAIDVTDLVIIPKFHPTQ